MSFSIIKGSKEIANGPWRSYKNVSIILDRYGRPNLRLYKSVGGEYVDLPISKTNAKPRNSVTSCTGCFRPRGRHGLSLKSLKPPSFSTFQLDNVCPKNTFGVLASGVNALGLSDFHKAGTFVYVAMKPQEGLIFLDDLSNRRGFYRNERGSPSFVDRPESRVKFRSHVNSGIIRWHVKAEARGFYRLQL